MEAIKVLGQASLAATTLTDVYEVPADTSAVLSTITICNRSATPTTYRVSVAVAGAVDGDEQYIAYDAPIDDNETIALTLGLSLGAGDVVRAFANDATVSVNVFGAEITT